MNEHSRAKLILKSRRGLAAKLGVQTFFWIQGQSQQTYINLDLEVFYYLRKYVNNHSVAPDVIHLLSVEDLKKQIYLLNTHGSWTENKLRPILENEIRTKENGRGCYSFIPLKLYICENGCQLGLPGRTKSCVDCLC